jgi:hypothetical protein
MYSEINELARRKDSTMSFEKTIVVRFKWRDIERVEKVADGLGLNFSEVIRRSVAEGIKSFEKAHLPGSPIAEAEEPK